ncbi:homoserine O-acetyltransferase [Setomelanomma holmii]|uniref:Homoserine O-acetyltransferase n=1 Tax=Setomelanomma holmii TaxID=210430 RepID=A0A9P4LRC8_9PLEO|nr:homoserine O-acetyltransferase [Setomelanomma holmii]
MAASQDYYSGLVHNQKIASIPSFTLESGVVLIDVSVAYSTWGALNAAQDNVLVVCHALTGNGDALDWWRPLMGPGKALDYTRYFIICANVLGSPYGSASPLSIDPCTGRTYGPTFPDTTIRDDVRVHKLVLNSLGVHSVAAVIGGSMGGMHTLEWPLCTPMGYIRNIIPIATSAHQGAWGISWGETQRHAIRADASFKNGWYDPTPEGQPRGGLGTARMIGMLTYRSFGSFEARFGRKRGVAARRADALPTPPPSDNGNMSSDAVDQEDPAPVPRFLAQDYLQYQADKFLNRFDANCYIHLTKKMDTHDVTRGRADSGDAHTTETFEVLKGTLSGLPDGALVVGIQTDLLFPLQQQIELAQSLPSAKLVVLQSGDGHDGFLLGFEELNRVIEGHLHNRCAEIYAGAARALDEDMQVMVVESVFGEAESGDF